MILNNIRRIDINKILLELVLAFCSCISHANEYQYWDDLDESSKSGIIKSIDVFSAWRKIL